MPGLPTVKASVDSNTSRHCNASADDPAPGC
jgi:hypothetical protein